MQFVKIRTNKQFLTTMKDALIIILCGMNNFAAYQEWNVVKIHQKDMRRS